MGKNLVFITKKYPFGSGEEFIENEMKHLENAFDKIYLICTSAQPEAEQSKYVPENATVLRIDETSNVKKRYAKYLLKSAVFLRDDLLKRELAVCETVMSKVAAIYMYSRTKALYEKVKGFLKKCAHLQDNETYIYSYWFSDTALLATWLKKDLNGKKAVSRAHGYDLYTDRNKANASPFRKYILENIDGVYPCSQNGTSYLKEKFPCYEDKISTSYLGTIDHGLQQAEKKDNSFAIATCSAIDSNKRVHVVAEALDYLEKRGATNIVWYCIGSGPLEKQVKEYVEKNIKKNTVVFKGQLKNSDVIDFYKNNYIDLFINVSLNEGLPVSLMEAQSFGIPTVATDVGGVSEIVSDDNGFLIPKDFKVEDLAGIILEFMNISPIDIKRKNARRNWENNFCEKENYRAFTDKLGEQK